MWSQREKWKLGRGSTGNGESHVADMQIVAYMKTSRIQCHVVLKNWDKMVRIPNIEDMRIQHSFGIWPLELLTIQRFSYISDEIPSHRVIISYCNTESQWQKHSCAFLLQRAQIAFWPEQYFLLSGVCILIPFQKVLPHIFFALPIFCYHCSETRIWPQYLLKITMKVYSFCR